jgi:peptidoglycan hydrolase-like protein with peptidoglycan-binding domain
VDAGVVRRPNATPQRIKAMQAALARKGYYRVRSMELYGPATSRTAVARCQRDRDLLALLPAISSLTDA